MDKNNQLVKYKENPIRKWFTNILDKIKNRFNSSKLWDKDIENEINRDFPNELDQKEVKELLQELLMRNKNLFMTDYIFAKAIGDTYDFNAMIYPFSYIISAVGTFIVSYLTNKLLARKIKKIDMVSSLKGNE
ncbi:MAG: hypothetical protein U0L98_06845 [Clostridia bacterium]|nr:hypothetical protein [Clostridia bacterium]